MIDLAKIWPEWKIEKRIGRGAYGEVYKAVRNDYGIESYSAIKIISIPSDKCEVDELFYEGLTLDDAKVYLKGVVDECVSEIRLMESLKDNSNVVTIEDYKVIPREEEIGWDIYIRMELLTPLSEFLCDRTLSEEEIVKFGIDICNALQTCEKKNIIHRDIKPENIMVNSFGDFKLGDFGIAKNFDSMTLSLSRKGTMNYMSPEVANGSSDYDIRVDIYSLGLVLYKLLNNNKMPFLESEKQLLSPGERKLATERRLKGEALPKPANASDKLADIILKACDADPNKRYKSPKDMKADFQKLSSKEEIIENTENKVIEKRKGLLKRDYILIFSAIALLCIIETVFFFINRNSNKVKETETSVIETVTTTDSGTDDEFVIDFAENKRIVKEAKERIGRLSAEDPEFYRHVTLEELIEDNYSNYAIFLISKEMIENGEFERAGELVAYYINDTDFLKQFFSPSARNSDNTSWDYRTNERYDYIELTVADNFGVRVFYKTGHSSWTLVEITTSNVINENRSSFELRYDTKGNFVHERIYHYTSYDGLIKTDGIDGYSPVGEKLIEAINLMNNNRMYEAKIILEQISDNKRAEELIKICDFELLYSFSTEMSFKKVEECMSDEDFIDSFFEEKETEFDYDGYNQVTYMHITTNEYDYREVKILYDIDTNEIDSITINNKTFYNY